MKLRELREILVDVVLANFGTAAYCEHDDGCPFHDNEVIDVNQCVCTSARKMEVSLTIDQVFSAKRTLILKIGGLQGAMVLPKPPINMPCTLCHVMGDIRFLSSSEVPDPIWEQLANLSEYHQLEKGHVLFVQTWMADSHFKSRIGANKSRYFTPATADKSNAVIVIKRWDGAISGSRLKYGYGFIEGQIEHGYRSVDRPDGHCIGSGIESWMFHYDPNTKKLILGQNAAADTIDSLVDLMQRQATK